MPSYRRAIDLHLPGNQAAVKTANAAVPDVSTLSARTTWMDAYIAASGDYEEVSLANTEVGSARGDCPKSDLHVHVLDAADGTPITAADVALSHVPVLPTDSSAASAAQTDAEGRAVFEGISPDRYLVSATHERYCPGSVEKSVPANSSALAEVNLRKARVYFAIYYQVDDNAFKRAAETWEREQRADANFCEFDQVLLYEVQTEGEFVAAWAEVAVAATGYDVMGGALFTHASKDNNEHPDGLEFRPGPRSDGTLTQSEISTLVVLSWAAGSRLTLMSCNSGMVEDRGWAPAGVFARSQGVSTIGQQGYAYFSESPTQYERIDNTEGSPSTNVYLWAFHRGQNSMFGSGRRIAGRLFATE